MPEPRLPQEVLPDADTHPMTRHDIDPSDLEHCGCAEIWEHLHDLRNPDQ